MADYNELYGNIAKTFLTVLKNRTQYFEVTYICDSGEMYFWSGLQTFTEEEMSKLLALREKYGDDQFFNHLEEAFDEDTVNEIAPNEIVQFDLDKPLYLYNFNYHLLTNEGIKTYTAKVQLPDELYIKLLIFYLADGNLNINSLKYAAKEVYEKIIREVDYCFAENGIYQCKYPYIITLDEAKEDVQKIKEYYPDKIYSTDKNFGYLMDN